MADKNEIAENFVSDYKRMGDGEKQEFARVVSKFLNETFILKNKKTDTYDFYFIANFQNASFNTACYNRAAA